MKQFTLLNKQIAVSEIHGEVMESSVSKELKVSGGGGFVGHQGGHVGSVTSTTLTSTKLFIKDGENERAVTVPGEWDIRKGHDIIYLEAACDGKATFLGFKNNSMKRAEWRKGETIANRLGVINPSPAWLWILSIILISVWVGLFLLGWLMYRKYFAFPKMRKQANIEVESFIRSEYLVNQPAVQSTVAA
jgi:hypothetical protein